MNVKRIISVAFAGDMGDIGDTRHNPLANREKPVPQPCRIVSPTEKSRGTEFARPGDKETKLSQSVTDTCPLVPHVPRSSDEDCFFERAAIIAEGDACSHSVAQAALRRRKREHQEEHAAISTSMRERTERYAAHQQKSGSAANRFARRAA